MEWIAKQNLLSPINRCVTAPQQASSLTAVPWCLKATCCSHRQEGVVLTLYSSLKSLPSSAERSLYSSSRWSTRMGKKVLDADGDLGRRTTVCCSVRENRVYHLCWTGRGLLWLWIISMCWRKLQLQIKLLQISSVCYSLTNKSRCCQSDALLYLQKIIRLYLMRPVAPPSHHPAHSRQPHLSWLKRKLKKSTNSFACFTVS